MYKSIIAKIILYLSILILLIILSTSYFFIQKDKALIQEVKEFSIQTSYETLQQTQTNELNLLKKNIELLSQMIAKSTTVFLVNFALDELENKIKVDMENEEIKGIVVWDLFLEEYALVAYKNENDKVIFTKTIPNSFKSYSYITKNIVEKKSYTQTKLGEVSLYYDETSIKDKMANIKKDIDRKNEKFNSYLNLTLSDTIFIKSLLFFFLFLLIFIVISMLIIYYVREPLKKINRSLDSFFNYLNDKSTDVKKIDIDSKDEFGKMAKNLNANIDISIKLHDSLEEKVKEKTLELNTLNQELEKRVKEELAKNRNKDKLLFQQSKHAAMGEMIGNIAHQWRQPLNELGLLAQSFKFAKMRGVLTDEFIEKKTTKSKKLISKMSETIEDFRHFFDPKREKERFSIDNSIEHVVTLFTSTHEKHSINIILDLNFDKGIVHFKGEFEQVLLVLLNNAIDALRLGDIKIKRYLKISTYENKSSIFIQIHDSAGGIVDNNIDKVFDPYFTTKSDGTGIGLYMAKQIIEDHMKGKIYIQNEKFTYESDEFYGAKFVIELDKSIIEN